MDLFFRAVTPARLIELGRNLKKEKDKTLGREIKRWLQNPLSLLGLETKRCIFASGFSVLKLWDDNHRTKTRATKPTKRISTDLSPLSIHSFMSMKHIFFLFLAFCCSLCTAFAAERECTTADALELIPAPTSYVKTKGAMLMSGRVRFITNMTAKDRQWLCQQWTAAFPALTFDKGAARAVHIQLTETNQTKSEEGYQLRITPRAIHIEATTMTGVFYALQSLRQLEAQGSVACCEITDAPQYPYRGLMLDCSRHFWTKEFILKQLDAMAYLKMNRLHLHLTDDAGWRMEIKQYPALTEKTAWRVGANWAEWCEQGQRYAHKDDKGASGGYYTQQDLREIVAYAAARHITVVPEIEMPGHSAEVLYA